jgi:signal transduction histidine kinase
MPDLLRRYLRVAVGLAVVVLAIVQLGNIVRTVRSQARARLVVTRRLEAALDGARHRLALALVPPDGPARRAAAAEAQQAAGVAEAEVFDLEGRRLASFPRSAPVEHWPAAEVSRLAGPATFTVGPVAGGEPRLLAYARFETAGGPVVLRLAEGVPGLIESMREHRQLLFGHAAALVVLLLAGGLALLPRPADGAGAPARLTGAYQEAMERLRSHGEELARRHDAERQRLQGTMEDMEAMARAGELTAGIVHEVRNGLGTIAGYARLLERDPPTPAVAEAARQVRAECETLEAVVRRFLEFARRETLSVSAFDPAVLVARVVSREARRRDDVKIALPPAGRGTMRGDEGLVERAVENLVRNALEAAPAGGRVFVEIDHGPAEVVVGVGDDGPGLPGGPEAPIRPFHTTKPGGLGLGLPMVAKVARLHGGILQFGAREPRGTVARLHFPRTIDLAAASNVTEGNEREQPASAGR